MPELSIGNGNGKSVTFRELGLILVIVASISAGVFALGRQAADIENLRKELADTAAYNVNQDRRFETFIHEMQATLDKRRDEFVTQVELKARALERDAQLSDMRRIIYDALPRAEFDRWAAERLRLIESLGDDQRDLRERVQVVRDMIGASKGNEK